MAAIPLEGLRTTRRSPSVLMLADHFGYAEGVKHGVTTYFLSVIPALQSAGAKIRAWFLAGEHQAAAQLAELPLEVRFFDSPRWSLAPLLPVIDLLRRGEVDVVHVTDIRSIGIARIASQLTGVPVLIHLHDALMPPAPIRAVNKMLSAKRNAAVCVSSALQPLARSLYGVPPERVRTLLNGVDLERFRVEPRRSAAERTALLGSPPHAPVLGIVARLHPIKGHAALFAAMPHVLARHPDAELVVVGDGPIRADLERLAADLGIARNIRFLGQRHDIPALLASMDLTVQPSESEGLGLAAIESLAAGTPVVAHDVGGLGEVVTPGSTGLLVEPGDPARLAAAICELLGDPARRNAFGEAGRRAVDRFALPRHVDGLLDAYDACAALAPTRGAASHGAGG